MDKVSGIEEMRKVCIIFLGKHKGRECLKGLGNNERIILK
jgi:hypothetical protein